jgi:HEAT repeat protein
MKNLVVVAMALCSAGIPRAGAQETVAVVPAQWVRIENGRLTLRAQGVGLRRLLDEVSQATSVPFLTFAGADEETISASMDNVPVEDAVRLLLGRYDSFFLYSGDDSGRSALKSVWIYRKGESRGVQPAAPETLESTRQIRSRLADPNASVRVRAFEALLARPGIEELDAITSAAKAERDDEARARMIAALRSTDLAIGPEFWGSLMADPSEQIRMLALEAFEGSPQLREWVRSALSDPSPHVRQHAQEMLESLPPEDRPENPAPPQ